MWEGGEESTIGGKIFRELRKEGNCDDEKEGEKEREGRREGGKEGEKKNNDA